MGNIRIALITKATEENPVSAQLIKIIWKENTRYQKRHHPN